MAVVGSAEVLIRPSFKGLHQSVAKELGGVGNVAGKQAGSGLGSSLAKWGKRGAAVAGTTVAAGLGVTLTKGFQRLTAIEDAEAMLRGLGHTTDEVSAIMQNAMDSTEGTAIAMDKIAPVAAQMVAAGIEPGKELEETLRLVGDAAMIAGGDIDGMSAIFGKVAASNRLSMQEVNQIQERGIPILQMIADQMGVNQAAVRDMVSAGEIDFQKFADAMESGVGGSAKEMGETTRASWSNLMAYVARAGAELLSGVLPVVNEAMQGASQFLKSMEPTFRRFGEVAGEKLREVAEGLKTFFQQMRDGEGAGGRFREILSTVGTVLMTVGRVLLNVGQWLNEHRGVVYGAVGAYVAFRAVQAGINFGKWVAGLYKSAAAWVKDTVAALANVKAKVASKLETAALAAMYARQWIATQARAIAGWIRETAVMVAHRVALVAQRGAAIAAAAASKGLAAAQWLINAAMRANPIGIIITLLTGLVAGLIWAWNNSETFRNIVTGAWEAIKTAASVAWNWIRDVFAKLGQGIANLKNYFTSDSNAIGRAFNWVKDTLVSAWNWVNNYVFRPFRIAFALVKSYFSGDSNTMRMAWLALKNYFITIYRNIVSRVTEPFKNAFRAVRDFFRNRIQELSDRWQFLKDVLRRGYEWIRDRVFTPVKNAFASVRDWFRNRVNDVVDQWNVLKTNLRRGYEWINERVFQPVRNAFGAVRDFFRDRVRNIVDRWLFMREALRRGYVWIRDNVFNPVRDFIKNKVVKSFRDGVDRIKSIWERIENFAKKPISFVINTVINKGLIGAFNWVARKVPGLSELNPIKIKGFARGGWTGPGSRLTPAGVVHADEYVVSKPSRRRFERENPGLLDHINATGTLAGYASGGLVQPVRGPLTSRFGASRGRYPHAGVDWAVPIGTAVRAALAGTVVRAGRNIVAGRTGIGMLLSHPGNRNTYYGHLSKTLKSVGQSVAKGATIALSGNTGRSTGPHLHFETWTGGRPVNPLSYMGGLPASASGGVEGGGGGIDWLGGLRDLVSGLTSKFRNKFPDGGFLVDAAKGMAKKSINGVIDWVRDAVAKIGDTMASHASSTSIMGGSHSEIQNKVQKVASEFGWGGGKQWRAIQRIISKESSWNPNAKNPNSSARGLFQKMTSIHGPVEDTVEGQTRWGLNYIRRRHGSPVGALSHHQRYNWYAKGGLVKPSNVLVRDRGGNLPRGLNLIMNGKRHDETILPHTPRDVERMFLGQRSGRGGVENHYHYHAGEGRGSFFDFAHDMDFHTRRLGRV